MLNSLLMWTLWDLCSSCHWSWFKAVWIYQSALNKKRKKRIYVHCVSFCTSSFSLSVYSETKIVYDVWNDMIIDNSKQFSSQHFIFIIMIFIAFFSIPKTHDRDFAYTLTRLIYYLQIWKTLKVSTSSAFHLSDRKVFLFFSGN